MPNSEVELHTGGALAVSGEQTEWTEQQLAVLRSAGVNEEVTPAELTAFLHECQRTKLDPFTRQIYLIGRYDNQAKRKVFRSQTGIDGYRVIANRVVRDERAQLEYEDTLWCGPDRVWRDVWLAEHPPAAAKVVVLKNGKRFPAVATLAEYAARYPDGNPYPMWRRMPANQLAKCAEALALRKAFPQDLAGIYTAEEMEQADARAEAAAQHPATADGAEPPKAPQAQRPPDPRRDLAILIGQKLGPDAARNRHAVMAQRFQRRITSFNELNDGELATAIRELRAMRDFSPPRDDRRYEELRTELAKAGLDDIDPLMHAATDARDAGQITAEQWQSLSDSADQLIQALVADQANEGEFPQAFAQQPAGASA